MKTILAKPSERNGTRYFDDQSSAIAVNKAFLQLLAVAQNEVTSQYMSPENSHRLRHRGKFLHPGLPHIPEGGVQEHSSEMSIPLEALIENDLSLIERCLSKLANDMKAQFAQMVYSTISETCENTGNVVDAQASGSVLEAFIESLEKIEFSVDDQGEVRLPELHMGPEGYKNFAEAMRNVPPAIQTRIDEITERKRQGALDREAERKARFSRYGDDL